MATSHPQILPTTVANSEPPAYELAQPIKALFSQLEDAMDFANAGGNPYTAAQVVTNTYSNMFSTGLFLETCPKWRRRPSAAEKAWANFQDDFAKAHLDLHLAQGTTQEGGYHSANNAMDSVNKTTNAFANPATATASDRQILADLTAMNKELPKQIAAKGSEIAP